MGRATITRNFAIAKLIFTAQHATLIVWPTRLAPITEVVVSVAIVCAILIGTARYVVEVVFGIETYPKETNTYNLQNCTAFCDPAITCSNNGRCTSNGQCQCNTNFFGSVRDLKRLIFLI